MRINVLVTSRDSVINKLFSGEVALGVSSNQIEHYGLEYQDFFKDEVILIVSLVIDGQKTVKSPGRPA